MTPRKVEEDAIMAYEKRTGFIGFGNFLERKGAIKIERVKQCELNNVNNVLRK